MKKIQKGFTERIGKGSKKKKGNCGFSFLIIHQNLTSGSFLKFSCNVKSELISINLFFLIIHYIKIHWSNFYFGLIFTYDCVTSFTGYLVHGVMRIFQMLTCFIL